MSLLRLEASPRPGAPLASIRFSRSGGAIVVGLLAGLGWVLAAPIVLAPVTALAGLAAAPWPWPARLPHRPVFLWLCLALLAWCGMTLLWSSAGAAGEWRFGAVLGISLGLFAFLSAADLSRATDRDVAFRAVMAGAAVAILALGVDLASGGLWLTRALMPNGSEPDALAVAHSRVRTAVSALTILVCGIGAFCSQRGWIGWLASFGLLVLCLGLAWLAQHTVAGIAILAAAVCGALGFARPELTLMWLTQIAALWLVAAPWLQAPLGAALAQLSLPHLDNSLAFAWKTELYTWRFVAAEVSNHPVLGAGFDASRALDATQQIDGYVMPVINSHPGSFGLQVWFETGAIGAALAAGALAALGRRLGALFARDRIAAAWTAATLAAAAIHASLDAGLWDGWFWAAVVIAGSIIRLSRAVD